MILNRLVYGVVLVSALSSNIALAALTCSSNIMVNKEVVSTCASFVVPNNSSIESTHNCNGYKVNIFVDIYHRPNKVELSAINPNGETKSVTSNSDLYWVDEKGDGIWINCHIP